MPYNVAVCVKPVPDPKHYDRVTIDPVKKTITRTGIPTLINPVDKTAIEAGLQLRERHSGSVVAISMAPPNAEEILREVLAMGADEAYLLSDRAFGGADTLATSYTLCHGLRKIEALRGHAFDFVLCGSESADGATAQVSSQLGEWLGYPHLWNAFAFEEIEEMPEAGDPEKKAFSIRTKMENGYMEWRARPPFVLGVARELNKPRFTSVMGIMKAKNKPLTVWSRADLDGAEDAFLGLSGSPTQPGEIFSPDLKRSGKLLEGSAEEVVEQIVAVLRSNGVVTGD
ncbi:MAG: electron transfer flavoprotein subunit beta/FixA family protein [Synergistaceae bacterium]|jgi:electron transfer flavoprotein beta subunit|nr:electron transfer flavoprotein subunit beta/FixA family protein [Synergistaceae bacterium]